MHILAPDAKIFIIGMDYNGWTFDITGDPEKPFICHSIFRNCTIIADNLRAFNGCYFDDSCKLIIKNLPRADTPQTTHSINSINWNVVQDRGTDFKKPKHLKFCYQTAGMKCNEGRHAQVVMKELGIDYQLSTPQSLGDSFWFWNCSNIPEPLPDYLSELSVDPMSCIGQGLNQKDAESIRDFKGNNQ